MKVARNLNVHTETVLKWYNFDESYLIFDHNAVKCYVKVKYLMKYWKKYEIKDCSQIKRNKLKKFEFMKEVHKKFWRGKEMKVIDL